MGQPRVLAIALLALLAPQAGAAGDPSITFGNGARLEADFLESNGSWFLGHGVGSAWTITMEVEPGDTWTRIQNHQVWIPTPAGTVEPDSGEVWGLRNPFSQSATITITATSANASIFIMASQALALVAGGPAEALLQSSENRCPGFFLDDADFRRRVFPAAYCPLVGSQAVLAAARDSSLGTSFESSRIVEVLVHDVLIQCEPKLESCPRDNDRDEHRDPVSGVNGANSFGYTLFTLAEGEVMFQGSAKTWVVGSTSLDVNLTGSIRLPMASGNACAEVVECILAQDESVRARGTLQLTNIQPAAGQGQLAASLSGQYDAFQLDETPTFFVQGRQVAEVVGLAALLAAAVKITLGVLATRTKHDPLAHPNRKKLYNYILEHPGGTFREVIRGTEIPAGTARHHLAILRQTNLIQEHGHKATLRYFENHGRFDDSWNTVVMLREPELKRLHKWLLKNPGSMQREILDAAGADWGWSRSTTQHRLKRLSDEGLIDVKLQGRLKLYTAKQRAPVPV